MAAYYNENDKFAAAWLRELIKAKLIADGEVDERSIELVSPNDVRGFVQCHFFAGIGGWSYALRLAGWPDDRGVWTGSCPCQPFSSAGAKAGGHDSRDLWPVWFQLIAECRPVVIFGEQVEAAIGHGWLDRLCDDLEAEGYAIGPCGLPGPSVGAFDIRNRLWFVAESSCGGLQRRGMRSGVEGGASDQSARSGDASNVADTVGERRTRKRLLLRAEETGRDAGEVLETAWSGELSSLDNAEQQRAGRSARSEGCAERTSQGRREDEGRRFLQTLDTSATDDMGHANDPRPQSHRESRHEPISEGWQGAEGRCAAAGMDGFWGNADWLACTDGKARPVEPGTFPLADGIPARVGRLRGYGNAIKPQVAQVFIEAYLDSVGDR